MLLVLAMLVRGGASKRGGNVDDSFEVLYREHYRWIVGFFGGKTRSQEECEDLTQETFLRAYRHLEGFKGEAKPSTWLRTIAGNVWINRIRDARAAKRSAEEVALESAQAVADPEVDTHAGSIDRERSVLLQSAIDDLPIKMKRCVWLRVYQERSYAEIAAIEGVTEGTVKSHMSRASEQLRPRLAKHYPGLLNDQDTGA